MQLCWSLFLIKSQAFRLATLLKRSPTKVFSCEYCEIFKNTYFWRTAAKASFCRMTSLKSVNFEQIFQMALVNLNVILIAGIYMELVYTIVTKFLMLKMDLELYMLTMVTLSKMQFPFAKSFCEILWTKLLWLPNCSGRDCLQINFLILCEFINLHSPRNHQKTYGGLIVSG